MFRLKPAAAMLGALAAYCLMASVAAQDASAPRQGTGGFRAGAAVSDVTPVKFPVRVNAMFTERSANQAVDRLYARSVVFDDGATTIVLCVVDTCMMPQDLIDRAKAIAAKETGIGAERMMICATHTHSGVSAMGCLGSRADPDYVAWLPGKIAESIIAAAKNLQPARIGWASVDDWAHTHNRRWIRRADSVGTDPFGSATMRANMHPGYLSAAVIGPSGPVDPTLSVLAARTLDGKPMAFFANYSQHYFGSPLLSADYFGVFSRHVAKLLGQPSSEGPFVAAMTQGTSGDLMWMDYGAKSKAITLDSYGESVARSALTAYERIAWHDRATLGMVQKTLPLGYRVPDEQRLAWAKKRVEALGSKLPTQLPDIYAHEAIYLHEKQRTSLVLQAIRIGDLSIAALPNEVYALTGLKLRAQSPLGSHFNIELANGAEGYIPPPEQHVLGGYTTWPARTAGLEVQAEPKIVETLLQALEEVAGRKRRDLTDEHGPYAQAILNAKPAAYWRLNDLAGRTAANAVAGAPAAQLSDGFAWYLPGVATGTGAGTGEKLAPSQFSGPAQLNRAVHLAGGDLHAELDGLGDKYSVLLWFWLGEPSGASERSGNLVTGPGGEALACRQGKDHRVKLAIKDASTSQMLAADDWHMAVLVRDGNQVHLHVDGGEKPDITLVLPAQGPGKQLRFGPGVQGKLDEIAVFSRALTGAEIGAFWKASGLVEQRAAEAVERDRQQRESAVRAGPLKLPADYGKAITDLKPVVHAPLDAPHQDLKAQGDVKHAADAFGTFNAGRLQGKADKLADAFSVSLWFRNETPNDAAPVTAYLFSRGPDGDKMAPGDHLGIGGTYRADFTGRLIVFNGNAQDQVLVGSTVIPPGTWNHVVYIRDGKRVRVYLDGLEKALIDGDMEVTSPGVASFFLGARSDNFAPLRGQLAHFALFDRALSAEEAKKLHTASGQPVGKPESAATPTAAPAPASLPLSPEESLRKIHVPVGFRVELAAAEPLLLDPVAFDWDDRGRLWVVEMADYPMGMDGKGKPGGRVRILEDSDADGRYDKSTLFAQGLNFPTGILTWRDGAIVTAAPNILLLRDSDGDGRADEQRVLVSGLQEGNQQLRANGLRWGLDNWVHVAIGGHYLGYGSSLRLKSTVSGQEVHVGSRDFRFRPDTGELEPQSGPTQFGGNRDNWGRWFGNQNSNPLWHYVLPDHYLRQNPHYGTARTLVQLLTPPNPPVFPASTPEKRFHSFGEAGHFTSACSAMIYRDRLLFPAEEIHAFVCEPFHNLVQHARLKDHGVTFTAARVDHESKFDFFASEDRWCRPVMVREGPDGALWVADMYRYMIEHPDWLPKEGKAELLPHYRHGDDRGRLYRISRDGMPAFRPLRLDKMDVAQLVAALDVSNGWQRDKAHQVLLWRGDKAAVEPLRQLVTRSENPLARLHALCVLDGLGELPPALVAAALEDRSDGVRENALRLAETRFTPAVLAAACRLTEDPDAKVRLQLAFSLGASTDALAGETLGRLLVSGAGEEMLVAAVMSSATPHLRTLASVVASAEGYWESGLVAPLMSVALGQGNRDALAQLLAPVFIVSGPRYSARQLAAFGRLLDSLAQRNSSLAKLRGNTDDALSRLIDKASALLEQAQSTAKDASLSAEERIAATAIIARDPAVRDQAVAMLAGWLEPKHPVEAQAAAIRALGAIAAPQAPEVFAKAWPSSAPAARQAMLTAWLAREAWALDLVRRLSAGQVPAASIDTVQRARLIKHESKRVRDEAAKVFATATSAARGKVVDAYRPALLLKGDPVKGAEIYRAACMVCHQRGSEGRNVGPDLASVVEHPPEKLLANILDPSSDIQPGYHAYTCTLTDGEQIYGLIASETASSVTMKLADGSVKVVLRNQIDSLRSQNLSLMPDGLEAAIPQQGMADLIAFLRQSLRKAASP